MFVDFLLYMRAHGLRASLTEWLSLMDALARGHGRANLNVFYHLARSLLVKNENHFDLYDRIFASYFDGVDEQFDLNDEIYKWLEDPVLPKQLTPEEIAELQAMDFDELRKTFEERLREQKERHDGGSKWVGTGGTSPFGHGGTNPAGVRVGGSGGGRSAVQVAGERRYQNLRSDRVLDTRQLGAALRRLRRLAKDDGPLELDIDGTIDKSARDGGEIDLVFSPPRSNRVKLLLLMDVGGSMDPHTELCERLFSAAHAANHFKAFRHYFFHNCPYSRLYSDMLRMKGTATADVLKELDQTWTMIIVGDAWMSPYELTHVGGAISYAHHNPTPGIEWLKKLRERVPKSVWLNPEPKQVWQAESVRLVRRVFPMYRLSLDGLKEATDVLRGAKTNKPAA